MQSRKEVFEKPPRTLCSPGSQLLQADPGSTLRLLRLRSGRADRLGEENLPSGLCGPANWEPWGQPGAPPGHLAGFSGRHLGICWQTFPEISPSSNQCDGAKGIFRDELLYPTSPSFTLSPPTEGAKGTVLRAIKGPLVKKEKTASLSGFCYLKPKILRRIQPIFQRRLVD